MPGDSPLLEEFVAGAQALLQGALV
jgi:hypothetical protein